MNTANDIIQPWLRVALWCALSALASNPSSAMGEPKGSDAGIDRSSRIAFLSEPRDGTSRPAEEPPPAAPQEENNSFDGAWTFTSAGCRGTGSLPARIVSGKIIIRGGSGQVDPDGTLHSVGAGNGMTLTAVGQLAGNTGSGTFNRSDGCIGRWIAIKH